MRIDTSKPMSVSSTVSEGLAPRARRMPSSSRSSRPRRAINWAAISSAANSAMQPNTPSAMEIGFSERSALATTGTSAWSVAITPAGMRVLTSRSTAGTVAAPPVVWIPKTRAPVNVCPFCVSNSRANAGVRGRIVGRMSTSSCTISEFKTARPTSFRSTRSAGATALVPKPGRLCCAFE